MTMPKQIDVKVTKPQNKHGQGRTRKCPILSSFDRILRLWWLRTLLFYVNHDILSFAAYFLSICIRWFLLLLFCHFWWRDHFFSGVFVFYREETVYLQSQDIELSCGVPLFNLFLWLSSRSLQKKRKGNGKYPCLTLLHIWNFKVMLLPSLIWYMYNNMHVIL